MSNPRMRAWDTHLKQWVEKGFHVIGEVTMFGVINQYCSENRDPNDKDRDTTLGKLGDIRMTQWIGHNDENGVDIYEQDLIKCWLDFGPGGFQQREIVIPYITPIGRAPWDSIIWERGITVISNTFEDLKDDGVDP
jgi:hypothetical protein